ncbi:MAG TPA: hypothetical protein VFV10_09200 [Gammaproteobacteria bacterium]|nr:hypothetical protein [Gammaproteobacteria bacterium]
MRRPSRGLLVSIALHATVAVLLGVRFVQKPRDLPVVMTFELVRLSNGLAPETGVDPDAPAAEAAADNSLPGHDDSVADGNSVENDTGTDAADSEELHAANTDARASRLETAPSAPPPREEHAQDRAPSPTPTAPPRPTRPPAPPRESPPPTKPEQPAAPSPVELANAVPDAPRLAPPPPAETPEAAPPLEAAASEPVSETQRRELDERIEDLAEMQQQTAPEPSDPSEPARRSTEWMHKGQRYVATFEELPAEDSMHLDRVVMSVSTEQDGQKLSTKLELKRLAFSNFAQFVDRWDPQVQIHNDRIDGRFHSNSEIVITKFNGVEPQFLGKVTTSEGIDTSYSTGHISRKNVFLGGLETRVRRIALPRRFLPFDADDPAERERVQKFDRDASITFYADGSFGWRYRGSAAPERRRRLPDAPFYLTAAEKADLYVSGVVNGKVLVYSPDKIVIADDLTYASDPESNPASDDYLGLVSDDDVEIGVPALTGPGDLRIQASIYARHRFAVRDFMRGERATLRLYGSLTAGSLTATEPRYRTELQYDRRFEQTRPPGFPITDRYEIASWNGRWTVEGDVRSADAATPSPPPSAAPGP